VLGVAAEDAFWSEVALGFSAAVPVCFLPAVWSLLEVAAV